MSPRKRNRRKRLKTRTLHPLDLRVRGAVYARYWMMWRPGLRGGKAVAATIAIGSDGDRRFADDPVIYSRRWFRRLPADAWAFPADVPNPEASLTWSDHDGIEGDD